MSVPWDQRHAAAINEGRERPPEPLLERVAVEHAPGRAVDFACGLGRHARLLAAHGWRVLAIDASPVAIAHLCAFNIREVEAQVLDIETSAPSPPPEPGFDLACITYYLHRPLMSQLHRWLKPGGLAALVIPTVDDDPAARPMNPAFVLQPGELPGLFTGWEILWAFEGKRGRRVAELLARRPLP